MQNTLESLDHLFCFTVDVEDSFPGGALAAKFFVDIFKRYKVKGTFFVTAEVINKHPEFVLQIIKEGHEIASHGYSHYRSSDKRPKGSGILDHLSGDDLVKEVQRSAESGDKIGIELKGYRAPSLRINAEGLKCLSAYFEYDSSFVKNSSNFRRCFKQQNQTILDTPIYEFPISKTSLIKVPFGGPYLLRFNLPFILKLLIHLLPHDRPVVYYAHSFEGIPLSRAGQKISFIKWLWYEMQCGKNIDRFYSFFIESLLSKGFVFIRMQDLLKYRKIFNEVLL